MKEMDKKSIPTSKAQLWLRIPGSVSAIAGGATIATGVGLAAGQHALAATTIGSTSLPVVLVTAGSLLLALGLASSISSICWWTKKCNIHNNLTGNIKLLGFNLMYSSLGGVSVAMLSHLTIGPILTSYSYSVAENLAIQAASAFGISFIVGIGIFGCRHFIINKGITDYNFTYDVALPTLIISGVSASFVAVATVAGPALSIAMGNVICTEVMVMEGAIAFAITAGALNLGLLADLFLSKTQLSRV